MAKRKKIIMGYGDATRLAADFKVSRMTVYRALSYNDKELAGSAPERLRQIALQRGGIYIEYSRQ